MEKQKMNLDTEQIEKLLKYNYIYRNRTFYFGPYFVKQLVDLRSILDLLNIGYCVESVDRKDYSNVNLLVSFNQSDKLIKTLSEITNKDYYTLTDGYYVAKKKIDSKYIVPEPKIKEPKKRGRPSLSEKQKIDHKNIIEDLPENDIDFTELLNFD